MKSPDSEYLLGELLKKVSRSFYLTLRVLPSSIRKPISLAYLLARAADTIADTGLASAECRIALLASLRSRVNDVKDNPESAVRIAFDIKLPQSDSNELALLESLGSAIDLLNDLSIEDRTAVGDVVSTLTTGMEFDLQTFPDERSGRIVALATLAQLDLYTYLVAGCVGEFWTSICHAHCTEPQHWDLAEMSRRGNCFGKALQLTNILRDCAKDLRIGRCYLPTELMVPINLKPEDLLDPAGSSDAKPLLNDLIRKALAHYAEALNYTLAIPRTCIRLRLACLWPIIIGLETLDLLARSDAWLDPAKPSKITRADVYRIVASSLPIAGSNAIVRKWVERKIAMVSAQTSDNSISNCPAGRSRIA